MFIVMLVMVALASIPLGFGFGRRKAFRARLAIAPMHRISR